MHSLQRVPATPKRLFFSNSDRNYWMTAEEAKEYGMIDSVMTRKKQ